MDLPVRVMVLRRRRITITVCGGTVLSLPKDAALSLPKDVALEPEM